MDIGIGILGFAHGHVGVYATQWKQSLAMGVRLVAGWDHDQQRAAASQQQFQIELADTPGLLLSRKDIDAVVIGAETSMHANLVEQAAATGKMIILQKPL